MILLASAYVFMGGCFSLGIYFTNKPDEKKWTPWHYLVLVPLWPLILGGLLFASVLEYKR